MEPSESEFIAFPWPTWMWEEHTRTHRFLCGLIEVEWVGVYDPELGAWRESRYDFSRNVWLCGIDVWLKTLFCVYVLELCLDLD